MYAELQAASCTELLRSQEPTVVASLKGFQTQPTLSTCQRIRTARGSASEKLCCGKGEQVLVVSSLVGKKPKIPPSRDPGTAAHDFRSKRNDEVLARRLPPGRLGSGRSRHLCCKSVEERSASELNRFLHTSTSHVALVYVLQLRTQMGSLEGEPKPSSEKPPTTAPSRPPGVAEVVRQAISHVMPKLRWHHES